MRTPPLRRRTDQEPGSTVRLRALVVDDNDVYRDFISSIVSRFGFEVTACVDGAEALELLSAGDAFFDFLVTDCEMPRLGGLELIRAVRALESHHDVYAVLLTGKEDVETKIAALRTGFDDCMVKSSGERELSAKFGAARRLVTRQKHLDDRVHELYGLATRDDLTGLFNRRFFFSEAERLLEEGDRVNLIFFDLDEFKQINDTLGHLAGDRILRDLGSLFLKRTRSVDLIARYGGDEFVMVVPALSPVEVEAVARRMASEIASAQWIFGTEIFTVGVTTGISCSSLLEEPSVAQLISAGDRDLYKNKWVRKNPDQDPSLYEYDGSRDAHVIQLMTLDDEEETKKADG